MNRHLGTLFIALFVIVDAGLCPVLCLTAESAEHGSSNEPTSTNCNPNACGACSAGFVAAAAEIPGTFGPVAKTLNEYRVNLPAPAPAFDIDHPPQLA